MQSKLSQRPVGAFCHDSCRRVLTQTLARSWRCWRTGCHRLPQYCSLPPPVREGGMLTDKERLGLALLHRKPSELTFGEMLDAFRCGLEPDPSGSDRLITRAAALDLWFSELGEA